MQRTALVAMRLMGLGLGLSALACEDKAAPAIVDDETIRWQLSGSSVSFKPHAPTEDDDFDVSCNISGDTIEFTIEAPLLAEEKRPRSVLRVRSANPSAGTCIVSVKEAPMVGQGEFDLQDECQGTNKDGGCTLTGAFDQDGWDFSGQLVCTKLQQNTGGPELSLVNSVASNDPVTIKLDNCD